MKQEWYFQSSKNGVVRVSKRYASTKEMLEALIAFGDVVKGYDISFFNIITDDKGGQYLHNGL